MTEKTIDVITRLTDDFNWHERVVGPHDDVLGWLVGVLAASGWEDVSESSSGQAIWLDVYDEHNPQVDQGWQFSYKEGERELMIGLLAKNLLYVQTQNEAEVRKISRLRRNYKDNWQSTDVLKPLLGNKPLREHVSI